MFGSKKEKVKINFNDRKINSFRLTCKFGVYPPRRRPAPPGRKTAGGLRAVVAAGSVPYRREAVAARRAGVTGAGPARRCD